jgi:O-ureido-D-serine cyclo-ligase
MASRVALVSAHGAVALDEDLLPLVEALTALGVRVDVPRWDDASVDWGGYDLAVLRSTWDYMDRVGEFLDWTERCALQTCLFNTPAIVRWNTDKHYLLDLDRAGVPVVPTRFVEPGAEVVAELAQFLAGGAGAMSAGEAMSFQEFVIKPAIGVGSRDAARYPRQDVAAATQHLRRLLEAGRSALLQPYLDRVDQQGETAVVCFDGSYSHAIRKAALLQVGGQLVSGLFAPERITPREADEDERRVAGAALAAVPCGRPLYARIDQIRDARGAPVVLELELTEPSLFFAHSPGSARRFAKVLLKSLAERR